MPSWTRTMRDFLVAMAWESTTDRPESALNTRGWFFTAEDPEGVRTAMVQLMEAHKVVRLSRVFERLDENEDNVLSRSEFVSGLSEQLGFFGAPRVLHAAFREIDGACSHALSARSPTPIYPLTLIADLSRCLDRRPAHIQTTARAPSIILSCAHGCVARILARPHA